jgi:hypothetical protein
MIFVKTASNIHEIEINTLTIGADTYKIQKRLKINLFTPARQLAGSKLILAAPSS